MPTEDTKTRKRKSSTMSDSELRFTINTMFVGRDAEIIEAFSRKFQCSRPAALRLILRQLDSDLIISLDPDMKARIEKIIRNAVLRDRYGFNNVSTFVTWAINKVLDELVSQMGTLRDPKVQVMLNADERKVAKVLLINSERVEFYGGLTASQVAEETGLDPITCRKILDEFVMNNWAVVVDENEEEKRYLPVES